MKHLSWQRLGKLGIGACALGLSPLSLAAAGPALPLVYVPGAVAVEAGSFGGSAALVWAPVLLVTLLCVAALAVLIRQQHDSVVEQLTVALKPKHETRVSPPPMRLRLPAKRRARARVSASQRRGGLRLQRIGIAADLGVPGLISAMKR